MSVPKSLQLPDGVVRSTLPTAVGPVATLVAEADASPAAVLCIHGFTGSKEDFAKALPLIASGGRTAIAIDLRGQHETPDSREGERYDISTFADDVAEVVTALDMGRVHLVGHSFGGLVARAATIAHPDLMRSVTLLDSGPAALGGPEAASLQQFSAAMTTLGHDPIWAVLHQQTRADHPEITDEVIAFLEQRFRSGSRSAHDAVARSLVSEVDRSNALAATNVPALVAFGTEDDVWAPELQREMGATIGADVVSFEGLGHSPAMEAPERVADVLSAFWSGIEAR